MPSSHALPNPTPRIRFGQEPGRLKAPLPHGQNPPSLAEKCSGPGIMPGAPSLPRKGSGLLTGPENVVLRHLWLRAHTVPTWSSHKSQTGAVMPEPLCSARTAGARSSDLRHVSGFGTRSSHKHGYLGSLFQMSVVGQMSSSCHLHAPACLRFLLQDPASVCP